MVLLFCIFQCKHTCTMLFTSIFKARCKSVSLMWVAKGVIWREQNTNLGCWCLTRNIFQPFSSKYICTVKRGIYSSAISIAYKYFLYVCTLLLGNYVLGVPLKLANLNTPSNTQNEKQIMVLVDRFVVYVDVSRRMSQKRGLTCEMVKMWMTRESSECFLLSLFYVVVDIWLQAPYFNFGKEFTIGVRCIVKPHWV